MSLREKIHRLYTGDDPGARRFQIAAFAVDIAIIAFFLATPALRDRGFFLWLDYSIAVIVGLDLLARGYSAPRFLRWLRHPDVWVDTFILLTLLFPQWLAGFGFLRVLRLWTLFRSPLLWRRLRGTPFKQWEDATRAVVNLATFLFVLTGFVYTFFAYRTKGVDSYIDALYFTVATVTTTGFGDITLPGPWGKLTSVIAMIVGISLFVRLAQAIFRPTKVSFACPECALLRHEPDAVFCKACGHKLKIPNESD